MLSPYKNLKMQKSDLTTHDRYAAICINCDDKWGNHNGLYCNNGKTNFLTQRFVNLNMPKSKSLTQAKINKIMSSNKLKAINGPAYYRIASTTKGLEVFIISPWLEKLFCIASKGQVVRSISEANGAALHDKLFYKLTDSFIDWHKIKNDAIGLSNFIIRLDAYGSQLRKLIRPDASAKASIMNLSFIRTIGIKNGINFIFEGIYSDIFKQLLNTSLSNTIWYLFNSYGRIIPFDKTDIISPINVQSQLINNYKLLYDTYKDNNAIKAIGVELEGGWTKTPPQLVGRGGMRNLGEDGSVTQFSDANSGELRSPPMSYDSIIPWVKANSPQKTDSTCGLHVHMSMADENYAKLMDPLFAKQLRQHFAKWGKAMGPTIGSHFWTRLNGRNHFCTINKGDLLADYQFIANGRTDYRYRQVNFCHDRHGTVEFRFLPMWSQKDSKYSTGAITELIDFVSSWIIHYQNKVISTWAGLKPVPNKHIKNINKQIASELINKQITPVKDKEIKQILQKSIRNSKSRKLLVSTHEGNNF